MAQHMLNKEMSFSTEAEFDSQFMLPTSAPTSTFYYQPESNSVLPMTPDQMELPPKRKSSTPKVYSSNVKRTNDGEVVQKNLPPPSSSPKEPTAALPKIAEMRAESEEVSPTQALDTNAEEDNEPKRYGRCEIKFTRSLSTSLVPFRATPRSAGLDLYSPIDCIIEPGQILKINMGLRFQLPRNTYGCITSRSSLASRGLICLTGTVDEDYRGNIFVVLHNCTSNKFKICRSEAIAQIICIKISYPKMVQVHDLNKTLRGINGFGSSNINRSKME